MNLNFKISKSNNLLFFVLELLNNKKRKFSQQEKIALRDFVKTISLKTKSMPVDMLFITYNEKDKWKELEKNIGLKNIQRLKEILNLFNKDFEKIWKLRQKKLKQVVKYFNKNEIIFKKLMNNIFDLCGLRKYNLNALPIHLIFYQHDRNIFAYASLINKQQNIVLECSSQAIKNLNKFDLAILAHEIFHLLIKRNKKLENLIQKTAKENSKLIKPAGCLELNEKHVLEELILSSFIPEGYLAEKYFNLKVKKTYKKLKPTKNLVEFSYTRKQVAYLMKDVVKEYVENKKQIDRQFVKKMLEKIIENYEKMDI